MEGIWANLKKIFSNYCLPIFNHQRFFFRMGTDPGVVVEQLLSAGFHFPVIGKPDIGGRGRGIKKLDNVQEVFAYALQRAWIITSRNLSISKMKLVFSITVFPALRQGNISGIVQKIFLNVTGDGISSVRELLKKNPRARLQLTRLEKSEPLKLGQIIPKGEPFTVSHYGNHARGALFLDDFIICKSGTH